MNRGIIFLLVSMMLAGCGPKKADVPTIPDTQPSVPTTVAKPVPTPPATIPTKPEPVVEKPVKLKNSEYFAAVAKNPKHLVENFAGKTVELTGVVEHWKIGKDDVPFLKILIDPPIKEPPSFPLKNPQAKVLPGQMVTLQANIPEKAGDKPVLWEVISAKGEGPPKYTLAKFAAECKNEDDADRLNDQWKGKYLVTNGEIEEIMVDSEKRITAIFFGKAGEAPRIYCTFNNAADSPRLVAARGERLKKGAKVSILGTCKYVSEITLALEECTLLEPMK